MERPTTGKAFQLMRPVKQYKLQALNLQGCIWDNVTLYKSPASNINAFSASKKRPLSVVCARDTSEAEAFLERLEITSSQQPAYSWLVSSQLSAASSQQQAASHGGTRARRGAARPCASPASR